MPLGFGVRDKKGRDVLDIGVNVDTEVLYYLAQFKQFPWICQLIDLDPYNNNQIKTNKINGLLQELPQLRKLVQDKNVPHPPQYVGSASFTMPQNGEPFDINKLEILISKLIQTLEYGQKHGTVWAYGD
ncbi:MAG: hypothetical protein ACF8OB_02445 [Phycisphaeraceae bacterium JB051]